MSARPGISDADGQPVYLHSYLAAFNVFLERSDVTDIYVNRPSEVWVETTAGAIERHDVPSLDELTLSRLARQIAAMSHQGISREHPLLSAVLPDGCRVQVVAPPASRDTHLMAIRKHMAIDMSLADHRAAGAFADTVASDRDRPDAADAEISRLFKSGDMENLLATAVRARKNILIAGGTSTGKTTFLNTLIGEIPQDERLIFIEDTPELRLRHANAVGLVASRSALGEASVTAEDLLAASLRMRPDRIILGELRGAEAFTFLRAINTGHPGSMTTVHADSPERAIEQIALLVLQSGTRLTREDVLHYVRNTVDVFVQISRSAGRRHVSEIALRKPV